MSCGQRKTQEFKAIAAVIALALACPALAGEPASRDELFGSSPTGGETPAGSRDALFGDETPRTAPQSVPAAAARISGFLDGLGAYTYADPEHWSRGVARLQLTAQGQFAPNVKWKLSGRADLDPVYWNSNFYPDAVKHDQRVDFFYRENYLDFSAADWDFRVGTQQIVWGEVIGLYFADVVSARDMREFLLPSFDIMRIPQGAVRAERTWGDNHVELIWIPIPAFDKIGKPGSEFYPAPLPHPLPDSVAQLFRDPEEPARNLSNSNYGVRANTLVAGWDIAAFYYRSFSTAATFYRTAGASPDTFLFAPRYDRIWQTGGTFGKDLGDVLLRGEAVYTHGQNFALTAPISLPGTVEHNTLDYIVSAEWTFPRDTRLNVQAFQRHYYGGADDIAFSNEGFGASLFVSTKLTATLEPQLLAIRNFKDHGSLIRPRLNWTAARNTTISFGADIFTGPSDTFFGRYNNRDRLYTEVRYDF